MHRMHPQKKGTAAVFLHSLAAAHGRCRGPGTPAHVPRRAFLLDSAEQRYRAFRVEFADVENEIPNYQVASYLGITPVARSRIKKRIRLGSAD